MIDPVEAPALQTGSEFVRCECRCPASTNLRCTHREGHSGTHRNGPRIWANEAPAETLRQRQMDAGLAEAVFQFGTGRLTERMECCVRAIVEAVQAVR